MEQGPGRQEKKQLVQRIGGGHSSSGGLESGGEDRKEREKWGRGKTDKTLKNPQLNFNVSE